jgi:hypothetical protein
MVIIMEPINTNQEWESPDAPSAGVERTLRLQNVATQIMLLNTKTSRNSRKDKKKQQDDGSSQNED